MLYEIPEMEILSLEKKDVICASIDNGNDSNFTPSNGSWA